MASGPSGSMVAKIFLPTRNDVRTKWGSSCVSGNERAIFQTVFGVMAGSPRHSTPIDGRPQRSGARRAVSVMLPPMDDLTVVASVNARLAARYDGGSPSL